MALIGCKQDSSDSSAAPRRNRSNRTEEAGSPFADDPLDPMLDLKKRARRRLIGAIALVIGAIVFVPMVFEPESRPVVDDISIQIPDKNTSFESTPAPPPEPEPVKPAPVLEPALDPTLDKAAAEPAVAAGPETVVPSNTPAETRAVEAKAAEPLKPAADDARAVALLEGKATASAEAKVESFAVQIGAFSDTAKVKSLRDKLNEAGFKTYTELVKTTQGERTRLRLGPYPSRAEAEKAQERVKKLFVLDATVVPL